MISISYHRSLAALVAAATALAVVIPTALARTNSTEDQMGSTATSPRNTGPRDVATTAPTSGSYATSGASENNLSERPGNQTRSDVQDAAQEGAKTKDGEKQAQISNADTRMMRDLAQIHLAEIKTASLATAISTDPQVRSYAEQVLEEHYKALDELRRIADNKSVILPGGVEKENAALLHKLALQTGQEFDRVYLEQAGLKLHQEALRLFQEASNRSSMPELKAYASNLTKLATQHLEHAQAMMKSPEPAANASGS